MSELGQWLQEARQAKELSLEQVEAETRIRIKFLTALEEGDFDDLPGEISTKGFLRNYALFLELDPAEALEKYEQRDSSRRDGEPSLFRPLEVALFHTADARLRSLLLLLVLIASLLTAGLWAWKTGRLAWPPPLALFQLTDTPTATPPPNHTRSPQPSATATARATATHMPSPIAHPTSTTGVLIAPTSTSLPTPTAILEPTKESAPESPMSTPSPTALPGLNVTLAITTTETSWVEVTVDGHNAFRGLMEPGEQDTWEARREIILLLGNAGGVQVSANGEFLGALGERQQVVEMAWGPEGEVIPKPTATATPEATTEIQGIPIP